MTAMKMERRTIDESIAYIVRISDLVYECISADRQILKVKLGEVKGYA